VAWSPNNKLIASASRDKSLKIWDTEKKESVATLEGHTDWVHCLAWSNDGKFLISGCADSCIKVWDTETHECVETLQNHL